MKISENRENREKPSKRGGKKHQKTGKLKITPTKSH